MAEQSLKTQGKLPDVIANAPELWPWLSPYYAAFEELLTDRRDSGMGEPGPIPWTSIDRYAERHAHGVGRDFPTLLYYVRALDLRYRKLLRDARPKEPPGPKPGKAGKRPPRPPMRRRK
jgi:hypothetical protein